MALWKQIRRATEDRWVAYNRRFNLFALEKPDEYRPWAAAFMRRVRVQKTLSVEVSNVVSLVSVLAGAL